MSQVRICRGNVVRVASGTSLCVGPGCVPPVSPPSPTPPPPATPPPAGTVHWLGGSGDWSADELWSGGDAESATASCSSWPRPLPSTVLAHPSHTPGTRTRPSGPRTETQLSCIAPPYSFTSRLHVWTFVLKARVLSALTTRSSPRLTRCAPQHLLTRRALLRGQRNWPCRRCHSSFCRFVYAAELSC